MYSCAMYKGAVMCSYITLKQATVVNMHVQIEDCSLVTTLKCISLVGTTSFTYWSSIRLNLG